MNMGAMRYFLWIAILGQSFWAQNSVAQNQLEVEVPEGRLYLRLQPLYLLTHATIAFEVEYLLRPKQGLSVEYFYSGYIHPSEGFAPCFPCWAVDFADRRQLLDVQYKFYFHENPNEGVVYVSPYARLRFWEGDVDQFVDGYVANEGNQQIKSTGLALGGTIGVRWASPKLMDFTLYFGLGGYIFESYPVPKGYSINSYIKTDIRLGMHLGFKLF
jgi:hypothetical protein